MKVDLTTRLQALRIVQRKLQLPLKQLTEKAEYHSKIQNGDIEIISKYNSPEEVKAEYLFGRITQSEYVSALKVLHKKQRAIGVTNDNNNSVQYISPEQYAAELFQNIYNRVEQEIEASSKLYEKSCSKKDSKD